MTPAEQVSQPQASARSNQDINRFGLAAVIVLAIIGGTTFYMLSVKKTDRQASTSIGIGEHGRLDVNGDKTVPCFETEEAFDAAVKAAVAKDEVGWKEALSRSWYVDKGTEVLVIGEGRELSTAKEVRVGGGEYAGKACWVMRDRISKLAR